LRIPKDLHAALRTSARETGKSLNQLCVELLTAGIGHPTAVPVGVGQAPPGIDTQRIAAAWADIMEGLVLFGSAARRQAWNTSDVDLLVVLRRGVAVTRELYKQWDAEIGEEAADKHVSPLFVSLPTGVEDAGSIWYEAALDGIVIWDIALEVSSLLAGLRREMAEGRIERRYLHGQPYWVRKQRAA